ncbi:helix-turn-helix transcriptional regulator [Halobellus rubicundus]|uniref:Helix-turn-helix transcriptional regulator n=1 Tax=Halobellus rubicundus TaxID=2996466 RepID=A0ABD5MGQ7_9EURY
MRTPALWFALLLVFAAVAPAPALAATDDPSASAARPQVTDGDGAVPRTSVDIALRPDRSAYWRIEVRYDLETENETQGFREIASRYESGTADVGPSAVLFRSLSQRASEATGREMAIENVTYHSSLDAEAGRGTLALTFEWTNFLRQGDNETLVLDDAFLLPTAEADDQRTWLSIFDQNQEIRISPPEGYTVSSTSIAVQQRESAVVLTQPSDFEDEGQLRITYSAIGPAGRLPLGLIAGALVAVALVAGAWAFRSGGRVPLLGSLFGAADEHEESVAVDPDGPVTEGTHVDEHAERVESEDDADGDGDGDEAGVDLSLLSDEERVERLLEQNGGRMKQATIVDETGWSDAKVSQLLSTMADEGRVDKLRLGRENLISLPDDEAGADDGADESQ